MESKTTDIGKAAQARAWLDMAQSKWRLQTMQHRSRYNPKTGEYRQLPTRIRRFLNGTPVGMKSEVLAILKESAPYRSPVFDCETDEGLSYVPTNTFIRKDGVEHTTGGKDPTYTIIQDLLLDDGLGDAYSFGDESSCSQLGETEYHWDEPSVMDCPDGSQGVSYQITDISRDRESDLFSYRVRRVQALTVHVQPQVVECDRRKRVTVETWDNVYGEPGAFRQDPARGGSAPIATPAPCSQPDGTAVKVDVYRNPDCTYRLTVQTVEAKTDDPAQFSVYMDQYKKNESVRVANAASGLPRLGTDYSGGVMTRYTSERNEDGTWNNTTEKETEREVVSSTVEHRITPRGTVRIVTDTNQTSAASRISTAFGSWKYTKTPGGRYTNEYVEYVRNRTDRSGLVCSDTAFVKTHEDRSGAAGLPGASAHVAAASGGLVTTWTYDTDSEGFVTKSVRTEQEHTVLNATRRKSSGLLGTTVGFQHRSVTKTVADGILAGAGTGTTVEMKLTNGNLWDVDVQSFAKLAGGNLGLSCEKTVFQHAHEASEGASAIPPDVHADAAGGGHTYRRSYSVDPSTGAITVRSQDTEEIYVQQSRRTTRVTARGTETRTTSSNATDRPADASAPGTTVEWELTPGGRYNVTTVTTAPKAGFTGAGCEQDAFVHTDSETKTSADAPSGHVPGGSGGTYSERTARLGDDGLWEISTATHNEKASVANGTDVTVTARGTRRTVKTRSTSAKTVSSVGSSARNTRTRGGLYDTEVTTFTPRAGNSGVSRSVDAYVSSDGTTSMSAGPNLNLAGSGSGGMYSEGTARLGDDGVWENTVVDHQEKPAFLGEDVVVTARGMRRTVKNRQADGTSGLTADDAGRSFRSTLTRGGLFDAEDTTFAPRESESGKSKSEDAFLKSDGSTSLARTGNITLNGTGTGGLYSEGSSRLGDDGLWEKTTADHREKTVPKQRVEERVTRYGMVTRETDVQTDGTGQALQATTANIGKERVVERTRGGRNNVTTTKVEALDGETEVSCEKTAFLHTHVTTELMRQKSFGHVDAAADGTYLEETWRITDVGTWEKRKAERTEETPSLKIRQYEDAFGKTDVHEGFSVRTEDGDQGGKAYSSEKQIRYVESTMTNGKMYNVRTTTETPELVDSGWLHTERNVSDGLSVYYDFRVFRNAKKSLVRGILEEVNGRVGRYRGDNGSLATHPSVSVAPNKFGLWDGTVGITTTFTPKAWSSGGSVAKDNWEQKVKIKSVSFIPIGNSKLLKVVTTDTHLRGGGVGQDRLKALTASGVIKGSQFSYHPGGQAFSYDLITATSSKGVIIDMPGATEKEIWNGQ